MVITITRYARLKTIVKSAFSQGRILGNLHAFRRLETARTIHQEVIPADNVPFRKAFKNEVKRRKLDLQDADALRNETVIDDAAQKQWELTIGLEIHTQLNTENKLFSEAHTSASDQPNTHVALFDFALPGSQPAFQRSSLLPAIRAALALRCQIQARSQFDRKHYFYADQPAGYQITQYYQPFAKDGSVILYDHDGIAPEDGEDVRIGIKQIQLEQDTAKTTLHPPSEARLDFNRVLQPLIEIITLPQIHHPQTAAACVKKIQSLLQAVNAASTGMELGGLRVDVNVSVRRRELGDDHGCGTKHNDQATLGKRTEIKNLSSIKAVEEAIIAERNRQISVLESGGIIEGETRGWTLGATDTVKLRGKEGEVDYRYMPDPDLGPLVLSKTLIDHVAKQLPRLPDENIQDLVQTHDLTLKDSRTLVELDGGERLDYFDDVCGELAELRSFTESSGKGILEGKRSSSITVANWVLHELGGLLSSSQVAFSTNRVPAKDLAYIVLMLEEEKLTGRTAKQLFARKFAGDARDIRIIVEQEDLALKALPEEQYVAMARKLLDQNPVMVAQIKHKGQIGKLGFFIGQMMRSGNGKVVAKRAEATLRQLLELPIQ
ncbi:MAG: hypothetical protein Q9219_002837 [cf. Caloplaca sp. 3 TL-2023]